MKWPHPRGTGSLRVAARLGPQGGRGPTRRQATLLRSRIFRAVFWVNRHACGVSRGFSLTVSFQSLKTRTVQQFRSPGVAQAREHPEMETLRSTLN